MDNPIEPIPLYDRLGGIFSIARLVDLFSDRLINNPVVGICSQNAELAHWSLVQTVDRLPGLKWMRTLWLADATGGPYRFSASKPSPSLFASLDLTEAHRRFRITSEEFDEVAGILKSTLDYFHVGGEEQEELLAAFMAHKGEVTTGSREDGF